MLRRQDKRHQRAASEPADMGPPRDTAFRRGLYCQHLESRNKLDEEPVAEKQDGGNLDGPEENEQRDKSGDAGAGITNEIGAQHPGNGAAGPDGGNA